MDKASEFDLSVDDLIAEMDKCNSWKKKENTAIFALRTRIIASCDLFSEEIRL